MNNETQNLMNQISNVVVDINDSILAYKKNRDNEIKKQNEVSEKSFNKSQKTFLNWFSENKKHIIKEIIKDGFSRIYSLSDNGCESVEDLADKFCYNDYPYSSGESHLDIILVKAFQGTKINAVYYSTDECIEFTLKD